MLNRLPAARVVRAFSFANRRLTIAVVATSVVGGLLVPGFALATGALIGSIRRGSDVTMPLVVIFVLFVAGRLVDPVREQMGEGLWRPSPPRFSSAVSNWLWSGCWYERHVAAT